MSKKQKILDDLKDGKLVNMFDNLTRYGTSLRSRIAELRAEGYDIEGVVVDKDSGSLACMIPEFYKKDSVTADMV